MFALETVVVSLEKDIFYYDPPNPFWRVFAVAIFKYDIVHGDNQSDTSARHSSCLWFGFVFHHNLFEGLCEEFADCKFAFGVKNYVSLSNHDVK